MHLYSAKNKVLVVIMMLLTFIGQAAATSFILCQKDISSSNAIVKSQVQTMTRMSDSPKKSNVMAHDMSDSSMTHMDCCEEAICLMDSCPMDSCITAVLLSNDSQELLFTSSNKITLPTLLPPNQLLKSLYYPPIV